MSKPETKSKAQKEIIYEKITTLAELQTATEYGPVIVERIIDQAGKPRGIHLEGRRLLPGESKTAQLILQRAIPPEVPGEKPDDPPRYDKLDEKYLAEKSRSERMARAFVLFTAFPIFNAGVLAARNGNPQAPTHQELFDYFETLAIDDDILWSAYNEATKSIVYVDWGRVGFTSGNNSPKN